VSLLFELFECGKRILYKQMIQTEPREIEDEMNGIPMNSVS